MTNILYMYMRQRNIYIYRYLTLPFEYHLLFRRQCIYGVRPRENMDFVGGGREKIFHASRIIGLRPGDIIYLAFALNRYILYIYTFSSVRHASFFFRSPLVSDIVLITTTFIDDYHQGIEMRFFELAYNVDCKNFSARESLVSYIYIYSVQRRYYTKEALLGPPIK